LSKNKKQKTATASRQGFTLVEIIITMGIIMLLSASMLQIVTVSETQQGLTLNMEKIKSGLRLAQTYSMSIPQESFQIHTCGFGVYPNGDTLIVYYVYNTNFRSYPEACGDSSNYDYTPDDPLSSVIKDEIVLDGYSVSGPEIFFKSPYAGVYSDRAGLDGDEIRLYTVTRDSDGQSAAIEINGGGKINF